MKNLPYLFVWLLSATLTACDPPAKENESAPGFKYIISIADEYRGTYFEYDASKRITKMTSRHKETTYAYPDAHTIVENTPYGVNTYTTGPKGRMVSGVLEDDGDAGECSFAYSDGYLAGFTENWGAISASGAAEWQGGNMTSMNVSALGSEVYSMKYGPLSNKYNFDLNQFLVGFYSPPILNLGKPSANLVTEMTLAGYVGQTKQFEDVTTYTYETDADGYVTLIHVKEEGTEYTLTVTCE